MENKNLGSQLESQLDLKLDSKLKSGLDSRRLKSVGIDFPFLAAPMVGLTHVAFRRLVRFYTPLNCEVPLFSEMLSTRRIPGEKLQSTNELKTSVDDTNLIFQLLGNEERYIAPSIEKLHAAGPKGFDINMGCPVSHTLRHNWGVRLMGDKGYAAEVVQMCKRHSKVPVSVKLRGGLGDCVDTPYLLDFTACVEDAGVDWLTVHPRPRAQHHKGEANWALVEAVRKARKIPVVGNGDVQSCDEALDLWRNFEVDGVMVGRALTARPWLFWQLAVRLGMDEGTKHRSCPDKKCPFTPEDEGKEYSNACLKLLEFMQEEFTSEQYILEKFRFFVATGVKWFFHGHYFWKMCTKAKSVSELVARIEDFKENNENPMVQKIKHL